MSKEIIRKVILVQGVVQGVGFRPFIYNLAQKYGLVGRVNNSPRGVEIEVEGSLQKITYFINEIKSQPPPLAQLEQVVINKKRSLAKYQEFKITESQTEDKLSTFAAPDSALCADCKRELMAVEERRYQYPFINCTNCGPRFSIMKGLPYDRSATTMAKFEICPNCKEEYEDPTSRRFHAQPNSCPDCGPQLRLLDKRGNKLNSTEPIREVIELLKQGKIGAVKGLGGFHLICNANNEQAVQRLRIKKRRSTKALAVMAKDIPTLEEYSALSEKEKEVLSGAKKPILLVERKESRLGRLLAPDTNYLGVMLAYTPLYLLIMEEFELLVVTSANLSGQPLEYINQGAKEGLTQSVDFLLVHDRKIAVPVDDAVSQVVLGEERLIRHGRGYAPTIIKVKEGFNTLACGGDLKNTFCLSRGKRAFLSQYTGSLKNLENYRRYQENIAHLQELYQIEPQLIAHDLHPGYYTTRYAKKLPGKKVAVQHHHAHIVAAMVEHKLDRAVLGLAFDGLGLGTDGNLWGGEFLLCDYSDFSRLGQLDYLPQPGGDKAVEEPWRMAVSYLLTAGIEVDPALFPKVDRAQLLGVQKMVEKGLHSPLTSSMGRLFAAVSALLGLIGKRDYQGQAAIKLERLAKQGAGDDLYPYQIKRLEGRYQIITSPIIKRIRADLAAGVERAAIARKFHNTVLEFTERLCIIIRLQFKLESVVLSGGVWQNKILLEGIYKRLTRAGFRVYFPRQIPCNDQGLALGQLVIANYKERGCL